MSVIFIIFLKRFSNILYYFLILLLVRKSSFSKSNSFVIYDNNVISFKIVSKLILIVKKSFIAIAFRNRSMKKMTL